MIKLFRLIREATKLWLAKRVDKKLFKNAKERADDLHNRDGKTYYVILGRTGYQVFNRSQINHLKRRRLLKKNLNFMELREKASYIAE